MPFLWILTKCKNGFLSHNFPNDQISFKSKQKWKEIEINLLGEEMMQEASKTHKFWWKMEQMKKKTWEEESFLVPSGFGEEEESQKSKIRAGHVFF